MRNEDYRRELKDVSRNTISKKQKRKKKEKGGGGRLDQKTAGVLVQD